MRFQKFALRSGCVWYAPRCAGAGSTIPSIPRRSFHSWHATSQALQPMQVVVSISLTTCGASRTPVAGEGLAEILLISMLLGMIFYLRNCSGLPAAVVTYLLSSNLLQLHQKGLVFRGRRIG